MCRPGELSPCWGVHAGLVFLPLQVPYTARMSKESIFFEIEEAKFNVFGRAVYGPWVVETMPRSTKRPDLTLSSAAAAAGGTT